MAEAKKKADATKAKAKTKKVEVTDGATEETSTTANEASHQEPEVVEETTEDSGKIAKAGKRSAKSLKEAEEKQAKEERKAHSEESKDEEDKPKVVRKVRTHLERAGKKFREVAKHIETGKTYSVKEALELAVKTSPTKFDATVELHINLGVDPRQADQNVRDNLVLPAGTGKKVRIAVLAEADDAVAAKKAGADIAGEADLLKDIEKGVINFDTLIATPAMMAKLGKYARVLGPKGLMPNPKSGTVTADVAKAVQQAKAGRVEYRVDTTGIVHLGVGKVSFGPEKLGENVKAVFASIKGNKPSSIKGIYVKKITMTTTMGPGIPITVSEL